ncbi:MAG: protein-S-isoprenylcysteine O-methyltransferase Ste14, partial [Flavobacteriaceae bacterium]
KGQEISFIKKAFYVLAYIASFIIFALPLLMTIQVIFDTSSDVKIKMMSIIGSIISAFGRILTLYATVLLRKEKVNGLVRFSLFKYSRNPISLGIYLTLLGLVIIFGTWYLWLGYLLFIINIHSKVKIEELELIKKYPAYIDYMKKTPRYILFNPE